MTDGNADCPLSRKAKVMATWQEEEKKEQKEKKVPGWKVKRKKDRAMKKTVPFAFIHDPITYEGKWHCLQGHSPLSSVKSYFYEECGQNHNGKEKKQSGWNIRCLLCRVNPTMQAWGWSQSGQKWKFTIISEPTVHTGKSLYAADGAKRLTWTATFDWTGGAEWNHTIIEDSL